MVYFSTTQLRLMTWLIFNEVSALAYALPRAKEYRRSGEVVSSKNGLAAEPTCEELKAMWRFSKRQSRAAEITNEIPMYRDPFADNVWEPYYPTSRSIGGLRMGRYRGRPIYGRVVHNPPYLRIQDTSERHKAFEEVARLYGMPRQSSEPRRRLTSSFRLPGGRHLPALGLPPQQGSFQHLKELIKTERARELQQQRVAEEAAAKAAALKDLSRSENHRNQAGMYDHLNYESEEQDDLGNGFIGNGNNRGGIISFPDILAPPSRIEGHGPMARFVPDTSYTRSGQRHRTHSPSMFDASSFNNGYSDYIL